MKVRTIQQSLWKKQKKQTFKQLHNVTNYPEDNTMIVYICKKHGFIFWRNTKTNTGNCLFCRQEGNKSIQAHHFKDSEITEELKQIIDEKSNERMYEGVNDMKVEKAITVDDGKYTGTITVVTEKTEPYEYVHFVIDFKIGEGSKKLDFSCPSNISMNDAGKPIGKLAETLSEFDFKLELGKEITIDDISKHFVGKSVESLLKNGVSKKGQKIIEVITMTPQ